MQGIAVPQGSAIDVATDGATPSVPTQGSAETLGPSTAASTQGAATTLILDIELKVHSSTLGLQQLSVSSGKLAALAHLVGLSKGSEVGHFQVVQAHTANSTPWAILGVLAILVVLVLAQCCCIVCLMWRAIPCRASEVAQLIDKDKEYVDKEKEHVFISTSGKKVHYSRGCSTLAQCRAGSVGRFEFCRVCSPVSVDTDSTR